MTLPVFPTLPGQGWSVKKTPIFSTRVAQHVSGREVRVPLFARALYEFELTFEGLDSAGSFPGLQAQSLQALMGFFLELRGQAGTFLYVDPSDNAASATSFGTADGVSTLYYLQRPLGPAAEPISYAVSVSGVTVNGVSSSSWTLVLPNAIQFSSAPASGAALAWSGQFGFQCRFSGDSSEFEEILSGAWQNRSLKFRVVR